MDFAIAKVSTKGQIVIPSEMRAGIKKGDEFLMVKDNERIILKSIKNLAADVKDDLIFADRVEKAWKRYDEGKFIEMSKEDFLKELEKW
jgi:AbrB family looped-hinge helix DNA binding protein